MWIKSQTEEFSEIIAHKANYVEYLSSSDIETAIISAFGDKDLEELLIQEQELIESKKELLKNKKIKSTIDIITRTTDEILDEPSYPPLFISREYQKEAYRKWKNNNYKGVFAMATGTGKTVTALSCILEEYKINNFYQFFILVPTIDLGNQWTQEVAKFNFTDTILCSSQNQDWEASLRDFGLSLKLGNQVNFCGIVTYASFRGKRFQRILRDLFETAMNNITLIADEAHTLGSAKLLKVLPFKIEKRIGLSATPERVYDVEGETALCDFFDSEPGAHTFSYNMKEAIDNDVLCRYYYYPKLVELEQDELISYQEISRKLAKFMDPNTGKYKDNPIANNLLIQRKNIIHKARNKAQCLIDIVEEIGKEHFTKAFIYVPEGYEANYEDVDAIVSDEEDSRIIDSYTEMLYNRYKFKLKRFTGETNNREEILKNFENGNLDALLAMKCLDEGVDVPKTEIAVFCSSTGNPRQYIQRRGRVLRKSKGKDFAYIYDMIVKPPIDITSIDQKQMKIEKNILLGEMRRLVNFAVLSENTSAILKSLEDLCIGFGIDIYEMSNIELQNYQKT